MSDFEGTAALRGLAAASPPLAEADSLEDRVRALRLPEAAPSRGGLGRWLIVLVVLGLLAGGGWFGYQYVQGTLRAAPLGSSEDANRKNAPTPVARPATPPPALTPTLSQAPVRAAEGTVALESKGYVIASHQVLVTPKVGGMVIFLNANEGRRVAKGETLAKIESVEFQSDYDLAAAVLELARQRLLELEQGNRPEEIAQSEAELAETEAQLKQLSADWNRKNDLKKSGILTATELEMAESQFQAMKHRVERLRAALKLMKLGARAERIGAARAEVRQREAEVVKAKWRLDNCTIQAPIAGTILKKNAEEGNMVDAHVMNGSYSLCEMADLSDIEVDLTIQERDISRIHVGQRCQVRAEAYPDRVYQGVVSRLMPIADRAKGAIPVRVKVQVPNEEVGVYLKPEMGAIVTFLN